MREAEAFGEIIAQAKHALSKVEGAALPTAA